MPLPLLQDGLHHHDRAIHQDAEVDRPQREQVGGNIGQVHQDKGDQQRERNRDRHQQRASPAPQEENQNQHHQHHPLDECVRDGAQGGVHQFRPVHEGMDAGALRQDLLV